MSDESKTQDLPGVEDDDPTKADDDPKDQDLENDADPGMDDLEALLVGDDEADDDDTEEGDKGDKSPAPQQKPEATEKPAETKEPGQEDKPAEPAPADQEPKFTQTDVERIIGERLGRDRKAQTVQQLEAIVGKPIEEFLAETRAARVADATERFGMTDEEAQAYVAQQEEIAKLKAEQDDLRQRQEAMQAEAAYQREKAKFASNPLAVKYAAEVDAFTKGGQAIPFEDGLSYILGRKLLAGELTEAIQRGTEQKTIAAITRRGQAAPEAATQAGGKSTVTVSRLESHLARELGLTDKEWAESKAQSKRRRG